jgi:hypothetical protein
LKFVDQKKVPIQFEEGQVVDVDFEVVADVVDVAVADHERSRKEL